MADAIAHDDARPRWARLAIGWGVPLILLATLAGLLSLPHDLSLAARLALFAFGGATILWTTSALDTAYVAFGAVLFLVLVGAVPQDVLFGSLSASVIWLLIGTFVISAAFQETGLAARVSAAIARGGTTVGGMCWRLTFGLIPLAFVIPSTSGRAAIMVPMFQKLSGAADDRRAVRALALLIPSVILVSTIGSLVGAGSHLIANDLLQRVADTQIGFGRWALYGLPFAIVASMLTCFVVGRLFLDGDLRRQPLQLDDDAPDRLSGAEWRTIVVTLVMMALWMTEGLHPFSIALVAMAGAFVLTTPWVGVIGWKQGIDAVSWSLIIFVGAALVLGNTLIDTGAARWLIGLMIGASGLRGADGQIVVLAGLILVSLTSHLYFTSHTARVAALLPPLLLLGQSFGAAPAAIAFVGSIGMDYCLTFPVSSKALLLFEDLGDDAWAPSDLLKLSAIMLPVHAALMVAFYYAWWRPLGLAL